MDANTPGDYLRELAAADVQNTKDCQRQLSKAGATFIKRLMSDDRFRDDRFDDLRDICKRMADKPQWAKPNILVLDAAIRWIREEFPGCKFLDLKYGTKEVGWDEQYLRVNVAELARFFDGMTPATEAKADAADVTWQEARDAMEQRRLDGKPYTSQRKLAQLIGCSQPVIHKAISNGSAELQEWASKERKASRKVVATIDGPVMDWTPQSRESDPADILDDDDVDNTMRWLMEQAKPNERARLNAMSPAERRRMAELTSRDPDTDEQITRQKRR